MGEISMGKPLRVLIVEYSEDGARFQKGIGTHRGTSRRVLTVLVD